MRIVCSLILILALSANASAAAEESGYLLAAELEKAKTSQVSVTLDVGGDWLVSESNDTTKSPLTVNAELSYTERLIQWSASASESARSLRKYKSASADIQVDKEGMKRELPESASLIVAGIANGKTILNGLENPLTRNQFDLVNTPGNTLALNRLLPNRKIKEGESWEHDAIAIGTLLGMDHIAVCEVKSVVVGEASQQVQIRMAGTVHGTIDGAPTEMELRGAYLFHQQLKQITKMNLAIKEERTESPLVPGLNVVAKVSIKVRPIKPTAEMEALFTKFADPIDQPLKKTLCYQAEKQDYRFSHDRTWYVTQEQTDMVSIGCLQEGNYTANCNITSLPARSAGRNTTLEQFEKDVRKSLGENLETITDATEWLTAQGHNCLAVIARGSVQEVPIEWRYYLLSSPSRPRVSIAVTIEQSQIERFGDADRQIVESFRLPEAIKTARSPKHKTNR